MDYPITVTDIKVEDMAPVNLKKVLGGKCGDMVAVRPCADEFEDKTFLGILLGDIPLSIGARLDKDTGVLTLERYFYCPAIFIPSKNTIVYGCGSWWGQIKDEDHLRQITDDDNQNIWYVKALKALEKCSEEAQEGGG